MQPQRPPMKLLPAHKITKKWAALSDDATSLDLTLSGNSTLFLRQIHVHWQNHGSKNSPLLPKAPCDVQFYQEAVKLNAKGMTSN